MDLKKGLDKLNQKLQNLPKTFQKLSNDKKVVWIALFLGIILIIIALMIW